MAFVTSFFTLSSLRTSINHSISTKRALRRSRCVCRAQADSQSDTPPFDAYESDFSADTNSTANLVPSPASQPLNSETFVPFPETEKYSSSPGPQEANNGNMETMYGENILFSQSLQEHKERREAGTIPSVIDSLSEEFHDSWALAVTPQRAKQLKNHYSRVGILIEHNFSDFVPAEGCADDFKHASIREIAFVMARNVYEVTGLPAIAEFHDMLVDSPGSDASIIKTMRKAYYTRNVEEEADKIIARARPISDPNRVVNFNSSVAYFDGEMYHLTYRSAHVAIAFATANFVTIAIAAALNQLYIELTSRFQFTFDPNDSSRRRSGEEDKMDQEKPLVGATLLKERILREGKMLSDNIIKVSSFMNHMVDVELMESCGEELAERLRHTMPNKILTVESTGLIAGLPTARNLGIPLVFARKTRPITISDSYQTTYRSSTKGSMSDLIVSCEYLKAGDRILIIDDFLGGGSTAEALFKLAKMAHAKVVGVGVLIEKMMSGGRAFLSGYDVPVESLAKILPAEDNGRISFAEEAAVSPRSRIRKKENNFKETELSTDVSIEGGTGAVDDDDVEDEDETEGVSVFRWDDEDDVLDDVEEQSTREKRT